MPATPWPFPKELLRDNKVYAIAANLTIEHTTNIRECNILTNAAERYKRLILYEDCTNTIRSKAPRRLITSVNVGVRGNCEPWPHLDMDESYSLEIAARSYDGTYVVTIAANAIWGALRALETLSQLVYFSGGERLVQGVEIDDSPRFAWRGLLMDTSRHFIPLKELKKNIEMMAYKWEVLMPTFVLLTPFPSPANSTSFTGTLSTISLFLTSADYFPH